MTTDEIFDIRDRNSQRRIHHDSQPHGTMYSGAAFMRAIFDCDALLRHVLRLERFLTGEGYRRCDAAACNCGSWHSSAEPPTKETGEAEELKRYLDDFADANNCTVQQKRQLAEFLAVQVNPDGVAEHADNPVNEADQHARHLWLCSQEEFRERMKTEPDFYDERIAGWWVWGQCIWIGAGWCARQLPHLGDAGKGVNRQLPHLGDAGTGVHRKLPHLGDAGKGVNRQLPHLGDAGTGVHRKLPHLGDAGKGVACISDLTSGTREKAFLIGYMRELAERLRKVRVCCGDWGRVCGPSPTVKLGITGVFLDPPYADESARTTDLYSSDDGQVAHEARAWAIEHGDDPKMRIALCGYEGEHVMPDSWDCVNWKARGGYGSQGDGAGRENSGRERIWFSPYCIQPPTLFSFGGA